MPFSVCNNPSLTTVSLGALATVEHSVRFTGNGELASLGPFNMLTGALAELGVEGSALTPLAAFPAVSSVTQLSVSNNTGLNGMGSAKW